MSIKENEVVYEIPMDDIHADFNWNIRSADNLDISDLQRSIRQNGQEQPGIVCVCTDEEKQKFGKNYFLMAGFRRYKACQLEKVPLYKAFIRSGATELERSKHNWGENHGRSQLNIYEESMYFAKLIRAGYTEQGIMEEYGLSRSFVQPRVMLVKLCDIHPELIQYARSGKMTQAEIRDLNSIKDIKAQKQTIAEMNKASEVGIKIKIDRTKHKTKKDRATMCMERTKVACQALVNWAYYQKIPIHPWFKFMAWRNGAISDLELLDVLDEINKDCTNDPEVKELIEDIESYSDNVEGFYIKLLTYKQDYQNRTYERPTNGLPEKV